MKHISNQLKLLMGTVDRRHVQLLLLILTLILSVVGAGAPGGGGDGLPNVGG